MSFSAFNLWNILEAKLSKLQIRTTVYNPRPHPVKVNTLPKCKARLRPQTGRPGPGLSPPTHCQLGCFSKTRKQVTLVSHFPHTLTQSIHKHTPQMTPASHPYVYVISRLLPFMIPAPVSYPISATFSPCNFRL